NAVRRRWRRWGEAMGYVRVAKGSKSVPAPAPAPAPKNAPKPKPAPAGDPLRARITVYPDDTIAPGQTVSFTSNDSSGDIVSSSWDLDGNGTYDTTDGTGGGQYTKAGT